MKMVGNNDCSPNNLFNERAVARCAKMIKIGTRFITRPSLHLPHANGRQNGSVIWKLPQIPRTS